MPAAAPNSDTQAEPQSNREAAPPHDKGGAAALLLALGIAVHLLFLLSLRLGWLNPFFNDTGHRFGSGGDFFSIYAAGIKARAGTSVYTIGGYVEIVPNAYAFRYASLVAYTLGTALSCLPAIAAYALWLIACFHTGSTSTTGGSKMDCGFVAAAMAGTSLRK